jgi:hypothetical protein
MAYDTAVNDFMTRLTLAGQSEDDLQRYINQIVGEGKLKFLDSGKYEFYPFGYS